MLEQRVKSLEDGEVLDPQQQLEDHEEQRRRRHRDATAWRFACHGRRARFEQHALVGGHPDADGPLARAARPIDVAGHDPGDQLRAAGDRREFVVLRQMRSFGGRVQVPALVQDRLRQRHAGPEHCAVGRQGRGGTEPRPPPPLPPRAAPCRAQSGRSGWPARRAFRSPPSRPPASAPRATAPWRRAARCHRSRGAAPGTSRVAHGRAPARRAPNAASPGQAAADRSRSPSPLRSARERRPSRCSACSTRSPPPRSALDQAIAWSKHEVGESGEELQPRLRLDDRITLATTHTQGHDASCNQRRGELVPAAAALLLNHLPSPIELGQRRWVIADRGVL